MAGALRWSLLCLMCLFCVANAERKLTATPLNCQSIHPQCTSCTRSTYTTAAGQAAVALICLNCTAPGYTPYTNPSTRKSTCGKQSSQLLQQQTHSQVHHLCCAEPLPVLLQPARLATTKRLAPPPAQLVPRTATARVVWLVQQPRWHAQPAWAQCRKAPRTPHPV